VLVSARGRVVAADVVVAVGLDVVFGLAIGKEGAIVVVRPGEFACDTFDGRAGPLSLDALTFTAPDVKLV